MIDIENYRKELLENVENEIRIAKIKNKFDPFEVIYFKTTNNDCIILNDGKEDDVIQFIKTFPPQSKVRLEVRSNVDCVNVFTIHYKYDNYKVGVCTNIPDRIKNELTLKHRCPVKTEIDTYTHLHTQGLIKKAFIPTYKFRHNKEWYGGNNECTNDAEANELLNIFLNG